MWPFTPKPAWEYVGHHYVGIVVIGQHPCHEYIVEFRRGKVSVKETKRFHAAKFEPHETGKLQAHFKQMAETLKV